MISRRDFVSGAGSMLAAGCLSTSAIAAAGALELGAVDLSSGLSRDKFQALVGQNFQLSTPKSGVVVLQLVELRHYPLTPGELATENFTLYFKGASSPRLAESLYRLEHGSAGSALLRLERVRFTSTSALYRAQCCLFA
jgi:hypothetical protein